MTSDDETGARSGRQPRQYQVRVRGHLGETMRYAFPGLRAQTRGEDTVLTGALPDQAALHGMLADIEALGLELLEVRRLPLRQRRDHPARGKSSESDEAGLPGQL